MKYIPIGRERISIKSVELYLTKNGELPEEQQRLLIAQWHKKCWKKQLNDSFTPRTKGIMESLGMVQDHNNGWEVLHGGKAEASWGNRAIVAEDEMVKAKAQVTKLEAEAIRLQKELDAANVSKDTALAGLKYKTDQCKQLEKKAEKTSKK